MPQRTHIQAELYTRKTRRAKWRFLLRNLYFRTDLNRLRHDVHANSNIAREIGERGAIPSGILSEEIPDLSADSIPVYETLFTIDRTYGDPEEFWRFIRPKDMAALPPINLGNRLRLDKAELYCKVYDLHAQGKRTTEISQILKKPVPTMKSALAKAKKTIEIKPIEHSFNLGEHRATCVICQTGQMCEEYAHAFQEFLRSLRLHRTREDPDGWRYESRGLAQNLDEEEDLERSSDYYGSADSQPEDDSEND